MKISILTPSRNRAENLSRMVQSAVHTSSGYNKLQFLNYIDDDDPSINFYKSEQNKLNFSNYVDFFNTISVHQSVSKSWNVLASEALARDCDILIMGNDDQVFQTQNWDSILVDEINKFDHSLYCMWFDDKINARYHCAFPIVPKEWFEILGYFTPGIFHFGYNDAWIFDVAKRAGITKFIPTVTVEHMHFTVNKAEYDETYSFNRTQSRGNLYGKDKKIYDDTVNQRIADSEQLKRKLSTI